jgi:hypothetical protein
MGTSSGHITNLKQSILETFNIYDADPNNKVISTLVIDCSVVTSHSGSESGAYIGKVFMSFCPEIVLPYLT